MRHPPIPTWLAVVLMVVIILVAGCGGGGDAEEEPQVINQPGHVRGPQPLCEATPRPPGCI